SVERSPVWSSFSKLSQPQRRRPSKEFGLRCYSFACRVTPKWSLLLGTESPMNTSTLQQDLSASKSRAAAPDDVSTTFRWNNSHPPGRLELWWRRSSSRERAAGCLFKRSSRILEVCSPRTSRRSEEC